MSSLDRLVRVMIALIGLVVVLGTVSMAVREPSVWSIGWVVFTVAFAAFWATSLFDRDPKRAGYDPKRRPPGDTAVHTFAPSASVVVGGLRVGRQNATIPLAELTCDQAWIRLRLRRGLLFAPFRLGSPGEVWIARGDWLRSDPLPGRLATSGINFITRGGAHDGVLFWHRRPQDVLAELDRQGWRA